MLDLLLLVMLVCGATAQLPTNCGVPAIRPTLEGNKIVSNTEAIRHSWPWQVQLRYNGQHNCGASIINNNWVLTAAHCIVGYQSSLLSFRAGRHTKSGTNEPYEQISAASRVITHEKYFNNRTSTIYDVAVVRLRTPFTFNTYVSPVCLAETEPAAGTDVWASGWGLVKGTCCENDLKQLRYDIVGRTECRRQWGGMQQDNTNLCAGRAGGYPSVCNGDSGGPLVQSIGSNKFSQVGISSYVGGTTDESLKCKVNVPNVFASVATLLDWIKNQISQVEEEEAQLALNVQFQPRMGAAFRALAKSLENN